MRKGNELSRRALISRAAAAPLLTVAGTAAAATGNGPPATPQWMREQGGPFLNPPYGQPSKHEKGVVRVLPSAPNPFPTASRTPPQKMHGVITPNGLFFERHHAGVPDIDPSQHRLMVHGMVERPLILDMNDIVRFPSVSRIHFLECSGNSTAQFRAPSGTTAQEIHGLLSCCWPTDRTARCCDPSRATRCACSCPGSKGT
jgi:sulfane dehydrogenase subunit SoxC